jgi:hypothetical protein
MCTNPILVVHDFNKTFFLECDDLGKILKVVLLQEGCPLEFTSKKLCDCNFLKSTYEKEMVDIINVVETRLQYIIQRHFQIKNDHHGFNYFLEQWLSSPKNINGSPRCWGMIMRSSIRRGKRKLWLTIYLDC